MCACIVPSASTNMMLLPPAPRAFHSFNSNVRRSGTKFVSHMCRPGARASASGEDGDHLFLKVPLRRGLATRRDLHDLHVDKVAAAGEMRERALRLEPWPGCDVELEQIEAEALVDRDVLLRDPLL